MTATTRVTINKGGTGERTVDLQSHSVPDAWHAIQRLRTYDPQLAVMGETDANLIEELWYLAHAMRDHIIGTNNELTQSDYVKAHMLHAGRRDATLSELLHNHPRRNGQSFANAIKGGIERALASQAHGHSIDNRVY